MSEAKRMSQGRRAEIGHYLEHCTEPDPSQCGVCQMYRDLLADAAYWRNTVKALEMSDDEMDTWCPVCRACQVYPNESITHKPDCLWLLAQGDL
jgi:hypothetical protein